MAGAFPGAPNNLDLHTTDGGTVYQYKVDHDRWVIYKDATVYLEIADIDDVPVNAEVEAPISSNWAFDHKANEADVNHLTDAQVAALHAVADYDADLMIGSGNAIPIPLSPQGAYSFANIRADGNITNSGANNASMFFELSLPTVNGAGLKLHITDLLIHISDADLGDYVNHVYVYGMDHTGKTSIYNDGTDRKAPSANDTDFTYATAIGDVSAYKRVVVQIACVNTNDTDLKIAGVYLKCYYDS